MRRAAALLLACAALQACATGGATSGLQGQADPVLLRKQLARSLLAHREWAAASRPLLELAALRPRDAEVHTLLGNAYREQGLFEQAEAAYRTALKLAPQAADAYAGLGILHEVRGDEGDAALELFKTAIKLAPNEAAHHNNLGFALYLRGKDEQAVAAFREGLRHDPSARRMRNNLGFVYGRLGHVNRAKREFEHGGSKAEVQNNLGYLYEMASDLTAACDLYREAANLSPTLTVAVENVGRVCPKDAVLAAPAPPKTSSPAPPRRKP